MDKGRMLSLGSVYTSLQGHNFLYFIVCFSDLSLAYRRLEIVQTGIQSDSSPSLSFIAHPPGNTSCPSVLCCVGTNIYIYPLQSCESTLLPLILAQQFSINITRYEFICIREYLLTCLYLGLLFRVTL